ncbi:MAG: tripartite tricarboxylate transporter substrate binding protein [Vannielia sp.]|uniref:Bug family tripartite tricarboxylate transporter substrate binding protein n=1 Tax=Vannielia sp. TaxID=2813045 RepID=UPI003B8ABA54
MKKMMTALAIAAGLASPLAAQDWPSGTVSIVVPYSPSGNTDILARHMAPYLEEKWGQPVVIDNRPGGGSMVGTAQVSQANPDGLTLLVTTSAFVTAPAIQPDLPFDPRTDLTPIANVGYVSYILVTQGDSPFNSLEELVADSKENPKFAATAGLGTTTHFAIEQFIAQSGANFDVVHFKGGGPAVVAILSGEADIYGSSVSSAGDNIASGKVKVLAVLGNDRIDALPDVPSTAELGYPETEIHQWVGVFAPGGTDPEIVAKINADINEVLRNEEFIAKVTPLDWTLEQSTPEGFAAEVDQELTSWKKLAEDQGISK